MPKSLPDDTLQFIQYAPYFALIEGKSPEQLAVFDAKYDSLPEPVRQFLLAPETSDAVAKMFADQLFPSSHAIAIGKLLGMVAMGDVRIEQVPALLEKLGLSTSSAATIRDRFSSALEPLISSRTRLSAPQTLKRLPPLTQQIPSRPPPTSNTPARNIIDLRNKPQT